MILFLLRLMMTVFLITADRAVDPGVEFTPIRSVKAPYVLDVYAVSQGERSSRMTMVTFTVSLEATGEVVYTGPGTWRKWDLFAIGWAKDGYTVIVDSGDVGTSAYTLSDTGWHEAGDPSRHEVSKWNEYSLAVTKMDYWTEQDSLSFSVTKDGQEVFRSRSHLYVEDAGLTRVEWLGGGPDIALNYPDGSQVVYRFDRKTWKKPD